ncbi:MAG: glycerol kinase GlpK [Clostridia bacterium]|nr:glycerol kinase GlpK [Clostridia bacterium]MBR5009051.1 glycerol kinase GlpK [Clostridia bacterium]MBR5985489.1 glycerol kinase GlpK [Clostridia bacterium]MBR6008948.1 glycerol kinase GlpK [Clostridia bacterium]
MKYVIALDQGTTSSRAIVFDETGAQVASHANEFKQIYPKPGWVEHDPEDIWSSQINALKTAVEKADISAGDIAAIGITNQRETTLVWDRKSGKCFHNAIVWQCRRTSPIIEQLKQDGYEQEIRRVTGLVPDAYFSGSKLKWLLDNIEGLRDKADKGEVCFGTVDSYLVWRLTGGRAHVTDATNASRTMLFNLKDQVWDKGMLRMLDVPESVLPRVVDSSQTVGVTEKSILGREIPICAMAGDQHAALFGQACFEKGMAKNTYGTGCFLLMNTGSEIVPSRFGLVSTMAWRLDGKPTYALEGSVFVAGAAIQWLRDELKIVTTAAETEGLARSIPDNGGVYLVPAFAGLGAPYWDMYARGTLVGLTRGTGRAHIARAALESIAYQSMDVLEAMTEDSGHPLSVLRADGGATANNFLMQFQADMLGIDVVRPRITETTALGAAMLAGRAAGLWNDAQLGGIWRSESVFTPSLPEETRAKLKAKWKKAVSKAERWTDD